MEAYVVTPEGVVLPKDPKYQIPPEYVEFKDNSSVPNSTIYGIDKNGRFVEKLRIDGATPSGKSGPNVGHYHRNGKGKHYMPGKKRSGILLKKQ